MIAAVLAEDVGAGDVTTDAIVPEERIAVADIVIREAGVVFGLAEALAVVDTTGELLLRQAVPAAAQAEPYLHQALGVARRCPCTADRHLRLVHRGI